MEVCWVSGNEKQGPDGVEWTLMGLAGQRTEHEMCCVAAREQGELGCVEKHAATRQGMGQAMHRVATAARWVRMAQDHGQNGRNCYLNDFVLAGVQPLPSQLRSTFSPFPWPFVGGEGPEACISRLVGTLVVD